VALFAVVVRDPFGFCTFGCDALVDGFLERFVSRRGLVALAVSDGAALEFSVSLLMFNPPPRNESGWNLSVGSGQWMNSRYGYWMSSNCLVLYIVIRNLE
jgi:hypothetical protein